MKLIAATKDMFKNIFNYHGRLSRAGYWWGWLGIAIITFILGILAGVSDIFEIVNDIFGIVAWLVLLFAAMRRYHDTGKPGWLALLLNLLMSVVVIAGFTMLLVSVGFGVYAGFETFGALIAAGAVFMLAGVIGSIVNLVFLVLAGDPEENKYGKPNPLRVDKEKKTSDGNSDGISGGTNEGNSASFRELTDSKNDRDEDPKKRFDGLEGDF